MLTNEKFVFHVYFRKVDFCGLRDFLKAMGLLHSVERQPPPPPGIRAITRETSFWMGTAKTHGLTGSCIIVQYLTLSGMAQRERDV